MSVMTNADVNKAATPAGCPPISKPDKHSLVELKNGKLVFKQKSLSFEKMSETMQEIVKFREMLEERMVEREAPLSVVPDEHKPVVAKLVHESDKTLQALSKHIQHELLPAVDEDEEEDTTPAILTLEAVEGAIKSVAKRVNYGLDSPSEGGKVPAAWLIWRWEVSESCRVWLPKSAREKVDNRWKERQQVKSDVKELFNSLSEDERSTILSRASNKVPPKAKTGAKEITDSDVIETGGAVMTTVSPAPLNMVAENDTPVTVNMKENAQETLEKIIGRLKKSVDPEKAAEKETKERERQEKKAAKAEREKKAQAAQAKSRSIMANFFEKAKPTVISSPSGSNAKDGETGSPGPSTIQSDFQRTFRPFALKKDAELAPCNWFREYKRHSRKQARLTNVKDWEVIVIDDDEEEELKDHDMELQDIEMTDARDITTLTSRELLQNILSRLPSGLNPPRRARQATVYKTYNPLSVRGLMSQICEAEVAGDDTEVRRLLALMRDRRGLPVKVLIFNEDARPGYFGTFTRSSHEIGPRTPFAQDVVQMDYGYDSGEEWAEEDAWDADDVVEDAEEECDGDEDADSDMDSWLVDDEEVDDPGTPIEERTGPHESSSFDLVPSGSTSGKRKAKDAKEKDKSGGNKKRRVVVPLLPFTKGPEWETAVGRCAYEPFKAYRIHVFNDTPFPIDPFKFVSEPLGHHQPSVSGPDHLHTADGFVIPALPPHLAKSSSLPSSSSTESNVTSTLAGSAKRAAPAPKTPFPDVHIPHLLARIESLGTSSLLGIVETVHRELQAHRVKKNAIEAKIKEVGEKCKFRKVWVVKPEIKAQFSLS